MYTFISTDTSASAGRATCINKHTKRGHTCRIEVNSAIVHLRPRISKRCCFHLLVYCLHLLLVNIVAIF